MTKYKCKFYKKKNCKTKQFLLGSDRCTQITIYVLEQTIKIAEKPGKRYHLNIYCDLPSIGTLLDAILIQSLVEQFLFCHHISFFVEIKCLIMSLYTVSYGSTFSSKYSYKQF